MHAYLLFGFKRSDAAPSAFTGGAGIVLRRVDGLEKGLEGRAMENAWFLLSDRVVSRLRPFESPRLGQCNRYAEKLKS